MFYICFAVLFVPLVWFVTKKVMEPLQQEETEALRTNALHFNHFNARQARKIWAREHEYLGKLRGHPDYEALWLHEIGAQILLHGHIGKRELPSYDQYKEENA